MPLYYHYHLLGLSILLAVACTAPVTAAATDVDVSRLSSPAFSPCDCDITSACDPSCCCDPDCARLGVSPIGSACASMSWSETVPSGSFEQGQCVGSLVSVAPSVWSSLLIRENGSQVCAVRNNNPSMGEYYTTTPSVLTTAAALNQLLGRPSASLLSSPPDLATGTAYQPGSLIHAVFGSTRRAFTLPGSSASIGLVMDSTSACLQSVLRPFLSSSYLSSCTRDLLPTSSLSLICRRNSPLDIATYLPDSLLATPLASNPTRVPITLNRAYTCPNAPCPDTPSDAVPTLANSNTTCENVVTDVHFTVSYGKTGSGSGWQVTKVVVDWAVGNWDSPSSTASGVGSVIGQAFGMAFVVEDLSASTVSTRSGNPGYIDSLPVLFLRNSTSPPSLAPLALPDRDPLTGACQLLPSSSPAFPPYLALHPTTPTGLSPTAPPLIRFLASSHTSCGLPWSSAPSTPAACTRLQSWDAQLTAATHVAMFGNQTADSQAAWVPIILDPSIPAPDPVSSCSVTTEVVLDLVWTVVGSAHAPQAVVVGARLQRGRHRVVGSSLTGAGAVPDMVPVTMSVKWTRARPKDVELETWYPPTPQLFPPVPKDWMYPFA